MKLRKIHIKNNIWQYRITKGDVAIIYSPNYECNVVKLTDIVNKTFEQIQAGRYPNENDNWMHAGNVENGMVKPSQIKKYIVNNLIK